MATGDNESTAKAVASRLRIDEVRAGLRPEDKLTLIAEEQQKAHVVAMAGDGINDAPALAKTDVGIAMGTGADVAMESAGLTLLKGDLRGVVRGVKLARATMRNIKQNLFFAFVYNALGVPIAAGVLYPFFGILLSPIIAAAAMSLSSVSLWATRFACATRSWIRPLHAHRRYSTVWLTICAVLLYSTLWLNIKPNDWMQYFTL
jgi:Cu+-exporting ATPase